MLRLRRLGRNKPGTIKALGKPSTIKVLGKKGFLLLEVLVSVAVITVGLIYIIRSFSISTRAIATSRDYIKAVSLLEGKIWEYEQAREIKSGEDKGAFEENREFEWELNAETEKETALNKTRLQVSWEERHRKQTVSLTTYLWNKED